MNKLNINTKRDIEKDFVKKSKEFDVNVIYPRFNAVGNFLDKELEFSEYESHSELSVRLKNKEILKERIEYGEDFAGADGSLIILLYKLNSKGNKVITEIRIIGGWKNEK